jgi:Kelch motif
MSTVRGSLAAAVLDDKVYAIGGGRPGISLESTEIYDPTLDTFMAGAHPQRVQTQA